MKKFLLLSLIAMIGLNAPVFAQEDMEGMNHEQSQERGGMMAGKSKMMGMMNKDQMVATSDGGIVLKQGPRLIKYDAQLNLVKEVELPRGKKPEASESKSETTTPEAAPQ